MGVGDGDSATLCSLSEMALCVLQGFAHGWGTGWTDASEDLFIHCCVLSEVGGASHTTRIRGMTPTVQAAVPALVKYQPSEEDWASTALGTAVGLWMQPETSCPCLHMAPSSVPQVTMPSWPSPGNTCITYTCTTVSMRVFLAIVGGAKVPLSNLLQGW